MLTPVAARLRGEFQREYRLLLCARVAPGNSGTPLTNCGEIDLVQTRTLMSVLGTKQHCGCRSSAWPEVEVLRTRIEGSQEPAGEAAFDPKQKFISLTWRVESRLTNGTKHSQILSTSKLRMRRRRCTGL